MHLKFYISPLVVSLALTSAFSAKAAELMNLEKESFQKLQSQFNIELPGAHAIRDIPDSLQFIQKQTDFNHKTHARLQQRYLNFPVFGGYVIIHSNNETENLLASDKEISMSGLVYKGLEKELGKPKSKFRKKKGDALNAFKSQFKGKNIREEEVIPIVYIDEDAKAFWAYKVSLLIDNADKMPERPTAILDAKTYKPFVQWNDIKTDRVVVNGMGHGGNKKIGQYTYGKDYPFLEITRDNEQEICYMETDEVKVIDMRHNFEFPGQTIEPRKAMNFSCKSMKIQDGNFYWTGYKGDGYDKINGAYSPSNDALYAGQVIKKMYKDWYKLEVLTKQNGSPMQLVMRVHYGDSYENAYWDGKQMTFGDGGRLIYPLVSLGIGAHEISHGFTEQHSDLVYYGQAGGMNESFSDMAAQAAEFYSNNNNNWQIGAEVMKESSGYEALRYMDIPSKDGRSIDNAEQYYGGLDVHYSSGVYNRLFYLMATKSGWDTRKAFNVMVNANLYYWIPYSTYKSAACGVLSATKDLNYSLSDVKSALDKVKIDYSMCKLDNSKKKSMA